MNISRALIMTGLLVSGLAVADHKNKNKDKGMAKIHTYEVSITNITAGQSFTPLLIATHSDDVSFFELGEAPSMDLADLAEGGATGGLQASLDALPEYVMDTTTSGMSLIGPGETVTVYVTAGRNYRHLSLAGMLLPTNDTFVAINAMPLPNKSATAMAKAYDAGSEINDELCISIPGPQCGFIGTPFSAGLGEGFVHVSRGVSGEGDLAASAYDWRNPVASVKISRMD